MYMKFRKVLTLWLTLMLGFTIPLSSVGADPSADIAGSISISDSPAAVFEKGNIQTIKSADQFAAGIENIKVKTSNELLELNFDVVQNGIKEKIALSVILYPSQNSFFENNALIGVAERINGPYDLLSFRIENKATSYTLLEPNLHLEGHTVLTVGLLSKTSGDIIYFQQSVDSINFDQLQANANKQFAKARLTKDELAQLEVNYLLLRSPFTIQSSLSEEVVISGTASENTDKTHAVQAQSLLYNVPDSIFMSGPFDQWQHYNNTTSISPYCYSYITYRFAGTDNRLTYIVFLDINPILNFSTQEFSLQMTVRDNVSVIYNVYTGELGFFGDNNRIKVNNITLKLTSNTNKGVFNARYYTGRKTGSNIGNIIKAIITWIPYAGTGLASYEYLTASSDTTTNKWFTYPATAEAQNLAYNGKIISEIAAEESGLRNSNDYFLLMTKGNGINSITWQYTYTAYYS